MATVHSAPGQSGSLVALITAKFGDLKLAVAPLDADIKVHIQ